MNYPIGIFDSGIGGVTVLKEILKILPNENYIYYSDSLHNPYGEKTKEEVLSYVLEIMEYFVSRNCKAVVFACNTATALVIEDIRKKYSNLIIIGIEPAYKMAYDYQKNKKILVMATPATINSDKFLTLYNHYNNGNTTLLACPKLAYLIEQESSKNISEYLDLLLKDYHDIDVVVLGCTHYPLIKKDITDILGNVIFFDGGSGVAKRLMNLLNEEKLLSSSSSGNVEFYDSQNSKLNKERFYKLLK